FRRLVLTRDGQFGHYTSMGIKAVALTPNGQFAILATRMHTLELWQLDTGTRLSTLYGHTDYVTALAITPNGRYAISASRDLTIRVWDLEKGKECCILRSYNGTVSALAITPDGQLAILAAYTRVEMWSLENGTGSLRASLNL